jgi:hypothetical protein
MPNGPDHLPPPAQIVGLFPANEDWIAAGATFLISGGVFFHSMSPEVTLETSGEQVTAAFNLGVASPPGYPVWTFLAWVWCHLVPFGNPAWRVCLMSVLAGASLVGMVTLLMTRSVLMLLRAAKWADSVEESARRRIALAAGSSVALSFGFDRVVWLWACVPEEKIVNTFMSMLTVFTFFCWMTRPERRGCLYATILIFGLSLANHQIIVMMLLPFMVGAVCVGLQRVWESDTKGLRVADVLKAMGPFWEVAVAGLLSAMAVFLFWAWLEFGAYADATRLTWWGLFAGVAGVLWLMAFAKCGWLSWKRSLTCVACFLLGCGFLSYFPISASSNPPMNWGYTSTKQGFLHHITRGQYEKIEIANPLSRDFVTQVHFFVRSLLQQYSPPLNFKGDHLLGLWSAVFAFVPALVLIGSWKEFRPQARSWLILVWTAFLMTSVVWLVIVNPGLDKQNQEINAKFFAEARGFYCMLVGYGFALCLARLSVAIGAPNRGGGVE